MHEKLIEAVRNRTILYDTNSPHYMKSKLKDEIWSGIAKEINLKGGTEAKNIWLKLRNCHRDALRRQRKCLKNGTAAEDIKQWKFQKQMEFLVPYMANKAREENVDEDHDYEESHKDAGNVEDDETDEFDHCTKSPSISSTLTFVSENNRTKKDVRREKKMIEHPKDLYHFFMSMYEITKKMPPASQHLVRNNVFQAVSQVEANLLNITHTQSQHAYFQHPSP